MKFTFALVVAALLAAGTVSAQTPSDRPPPRDARYDAPPQSENTKIAYADVLRVDPVYDRVQTNGAHEECEDVPVERHVDGGGNNAPSEDCGEQYDGGFWNDAACGTKLRFVCECALP